MKKLIIIMAILALISGCCTVPSQEREAHYVNGKRYIPMLKAYIQNDASIDHRLKDTYYMGLDTWWKLIIEKREDE